MAYDLSAAGQMVRMNTAVRHGFSPQGGGLTLPDAALAATYLRRLGYGETEAASLVSKRPLAEGSSTKETISELVRRHVYRIPFENLDQHPIPSDGGDPCKAVSIEERLARLDDVRSIVERIALGFRGGFCFDLNLSFAWLLRQLGASVKLALAQVRPPSGYEGKATHAISIVNYGNESGIVDVGFPECPRQVVGFDGSTVDDMSSYEVGAAGDGDPEGFTRVLRRKRNFARGANIADVAEEGELPPPEWETAYAFRAEDDLEYNCEEFKLGLQYVLTPGNSLFSKGKIISLATPQGYVTLSENRQKTTKQGEVKEEIAVDGDETWSRLARNLLTTPILTPPVDLPASNGSAADRYKQTLARQRTDSLRSNGYTPSNEAPRVDIRPRHTLPAGDISSASTQIQKARESQEAARSKTASLGNVDSKSLAVGGAGQGGGLGLNRPGFGPKVTHFAGANNKSSSLDISPDIVKAWAQVMDDKDETAWVFCSYSADSKSLDLAAKGEGGLSNFKEKLGDSIAWGGFRCYGVDKRGTTECKRPKFVFVQYRPESTSAMKKAKQGSHKGEMKDALCGAHLDVVVESLADLDEQALIDKLTAAAGAHKPNGYEFDPGKFLEADFYGLGIGKDCKAETSRN